MITLKPLLFSVLEGSFDPEKIISSLRVYIVR